MRDFGNIHRLSNEVSKAEECYQEALNILENLAGRAHSVYQRYVTMIPSRFLLHHSQQAETEKANSIRRRLEELGSSDTSDQEFWLEEEDTEAGAFYDSSIS